ncbi:bifunctional adenosylcobinamide kinase/adenosylcobinamide-phosphate guanylyltransferase [Pseudoduganella armeniaca]|uniref:Bifunctional adenosylcobalamin biosynthesis protein n=1 Tax=Pseudoduganella armeniaca TaxID=2072590 RepID=A0A2R4C706_9BURK|nr:bifunctional adenosylcobinamide kinase/adenosylcobinamide-phosphate guanylyltransferase [Pseudoduganella armeniaca]AVR95332.1 bifunctional adenosylcobinamide kinase/adenosylcobinamide-phosphate guanylyltransferase [Pseudoduganella armeniaca]
MTRTLVLGGARSGKSAYAERLAAQSGKEVIYVATAAAGDGEMAQRIALHRAQRPAQWKTVEEKLALAQVLATWRAAHRLVLVDCLTLWLSNLLFHDGTVYPDVGAIELPARLHDERAALLAELAEPRGDVIFVSNEVGMGIVPYGAITRAYTDEAGRLNQAVAALCDRAVFVAAGLPLVLKGAPC